MVVDPAGKATDWTRLVAVDPSSRLLFDAERVDGGQFRFEGLKPGQYDLEVSAEGFASSTQAATAPNERLKLILKQATRVFGTVVDEEDNALTASVFLVPLDSAGTRMNNRTLSTKNGAFAIDDASPGRYELCAALLDEKENPTATIKKTLDVRDSPVEVKLVFRRGEEIEGRIFDSAGAPLSEATVYAVPVGLSDLQGIDARIRVRAAVADPEGKFTIRFLEPGKYRFNAMERDSSRIQTHLAVAPAGTRGLRLEFRTGSLVKGQVVTPAGEPVQAYRVNGIPVNDQDGNFSGRFSDGQLVIEARGWPRVTRHFDSQQSKAQDLGVIRLQRAELISGQVVDRRTREPILGVQLSAHSDEARASDADWDARFSLNSTASDSAGRFELAAGEGPLRVRASHRGYLTSDVAVLTVRSLVIELDRGVEISGRVLDASGLPAQGVTVDAYSKGSVRDAKTDDDGRFRLSGLVAGDWRLGVHGWGVPYVPFSVPPTGLTNLTLKAPSKGVTVNVTLQGVLELDHVKAVLVPGQLVPPRTFLELFGVSSQGYVGESSRTGFQFLFVPPGDYTLFVAQIEFGGGDNSFYTVPLKVPNKSPAEFTLSPPAAVTFVFPGQR